jgi:hypothetical protein
MKSVPGLNAVHVINGLRLNDKWDPDANEGLGAPILPRIRVTKITGWNNRPEMEDRRDKLVGRPLRESFRRTQLEGKPITYEGIIEARNQVELESYQGEILAALSTVEELTINVEDYYSSDVFFYRGRITALDPPEEPPSSRIRYPYSRTFTLGIYMADPRKYLLTPVVAETGVIPSDYLPGQGILLPFTPPVTLPAQPQQAPAPTNTDPNTLTVENEGTAPTDPVFEFPTLTGASLIFRNESIGTRQLAFVGISGSLGVVDFDMRTYTIGGVDQVSRLDFSGSDWWDPGIDGLRAGTNFLRLVSGATSMRVRFWHAFF